MSDKVSNAEMRVGLGPRVVAATWFGGTACIPIVLFFAIFGRNADFEPAALLDGAVASIYVALPICMAAFFGFTIGSKILDSQCVTHAAPAAGYGMIVAVLSYCGMMGGFGLIMTFGGIATGGYLPAISSLLLIAVFGAFYIGWAIVLFGAIGGWLLFRWAWNSLNAPTISWVHKDVALRLNAWALAALLVAMLACLLPWLRVAAHERAERTRRDLYNAVSVGDHESLERLMAAGVSPDERDVADEPLLWTAAENGNTRVVKILLQHGANPNVASHHNPHSTPLHAAVMNFDVESIKALLDCGANINAADDYGNTPFLTAVVTTDSETVKLLIDRGADAHRQAKDGSTALTIARRSRYSTGNRDRSPVGNESSLDAGRNFGDSRDSGNPVIMQRAHDRHDAIVRLLMSYGIN